MPAFATLTVCSTRCGMQLRRAAAAALEEPDDRAGWFPYFRCEIPRAVYPRPVPREELPELECEIPTLAQVNARIAQRRRRAA